MEVWEQTSSLLDEEIEYLECHAALHYDDLTQAGPPARPLEFPTPSVYNCEMVAITALDHRTGKTYELKNVIIKTTHDSNGNIIQPRYAYMVKKTLSKSCYGSVRLCVVLEKRDINPEYPMGANQDADKLVQWESTEKLVVLKASSWSKMRQLRGMHLEDPIREIAAMQHIGRSTAHILECIEVLQDENWLYTITPYCSGGDLYGKIMSEDGHYSSKSSAKTNNPRVEHESKVRRWFRQLLVGLYNLQRAGVCHRDICLENIMLDNNDNLVIVDFGLSLRVPYCDAHNYGSVTDVSEGTSRLLMKAQGQGGSLMYNAPEILERNEAFDGHAIDLWSAGVVLFVLLVGSEPFKWAHLTDKRYEMISKGQLKEHLKKLKISISPEACDLLQNMMWRDPSDRLTLADVMRHPWVFDEEHNRSSRSQGEVENNKPQKKKEWSNTLNTTLQVLGMQQKTHEEDTVGGIESKPQKKKEWSNSLNTTLQTLRMQQKAFEEDIIGGEQENKPQKKKEWSNSLNTTLQALGMQKTDDRPSRVLTEKLNVYSK